MKRGERALTLCMPITCKRREENSDEEHTFTSFVYKARWFTLSQTDGQELEPITIPEWDAERALTALSIERVPFDHTDGNVQGFARKRQVAINPLAQLPFKTLFHELAHVILCTQTREISRTMRRRRAVCVKSKPNPWRFFVANLWALREPSFAEVIFRTGCSRGSGFNAEAIPEKSAQKIFRAADQIIRAGRPEIAPVTA